MSRRFVIPLLFAAVLGSLAAPASAATEPVHLRQVITGGYPTISITFSGPEGLSARNIRITEAGALVRILSVRPLASTGRSFDVVLVIDTSDSVQGAPLAAAVAAAQAFVKGVPPQVPIGVLTFSDKPAVVQAITGDHQAVLGAIAGISQTRAGTHLFDAVAAATRMFHGTAQHNVILLTDGRDVGSAGTLASALAAAKKAGVSVFTVGLGDKVSTPVLQTLATQTHGVYLPAAQQAQLSSIYQDLATQLSRQYVVLYRSKAAGGSQVTVSVQAGGTTDTASVLLPRPAVLAPAKTGTSFPGGVVGLAIVLGLAFCSVFTLILSTVGSASAARRRRDLTKRMLGTLQPAGGPEGQPDTGGMGGWIPDPVVSAAGAVADIGGFSASLEKRLEQAGLPMKVGEFAALPAFGAIGGALVFGLLFQSWIFALVFLVLGAVAPLVFLRFKQNQRIGRLHEQLPDILMVMASALRAGHSFLQALDMVSKEMGDPAGPEFSRVVAEVRLGRPIDDALVSLGERVGTEEFKWAMMAVNVQREVGGNLAEILDIIATTVRERDAVRRQIKVLSSEGRLSIRILIALPIVVTLAVAKINPKYMRLLWTTRVGVFMIVIAACLMIIGFFWAQKLVKIDV